ncbi:MAG: phosphoglycerate kinase [Pseudomonadota bacterium]
MTIKYIDELPISEKRVFIRVDFNVKLDGAGGVADDTRIKAALPTIHYALGQNAKVILASHLGRPKGQRDPKLSMRPVGERLAELLSGVEVIVPEDCVGDGVKKLAMDMQPGQVMLLENLRFHKEETANDAQFSRRLADLAEVYINDAFGTAHRAHASTVGMVQYISIKGAGFLMRAEVTAFTNLLEKPARPFVAVLGGAKVSDKIGVIENLMNICDKILIGGGMSYTFLASQGIAIGKSLFEEDKIHTARRILERAQTRGIPILLPKDHVIASACEQGAIPSTTDSVEIPDDMMGLDIGPKTILAYCDEIRDSKTIFWNGPMGVFEFSQFAKGTNKIAQAVADSGANSVVGGGDSIAAINKAGLADKIGHLSTGGGASLEFVEGKKLPGLVALEV